MAHNKPDMTRELTLYSQEEVLGFKHNVNRCTRIQPGLVLSEHGTPAWYGVNPETLKDFKHISYPGIVTECWNYVADKMLEELSTMHESRRPLIEFKNLVPIPSSFTRREFVRV